VSLTELPRPGALIFDLDGTLVDTVETRIRAWLTTFDEIGIPADRDHVASLIGSDGKHLAREVAQAAGRAISDERAEEIDQRAGAVYGEMNTDPRPLPDVRELLLALDEAGITWAIATSSRAEQVQASVDALELPRQPHITDGSHVEHAKPAPDLLLHAAQELELSPRDCWYVGDAVWDVLAARAAAMPCVAIATGGASEQELADAGADAVATVGQLRAELAHRRLTDI
jgi:HAD superfamily hydrolase (TIGR01509 family)